MRERRENVFFRGGNMPENLPFAIFAPFVVINRYSRDSKRCGCSAGRNYEMRERRENVLEG